MTNTRKIRVFNWDLSKQGDIFAIADMGSINCIHKV